MLQTIAGLRKEIEDLKSRAITWIPVTERLPEKMGHYLIFSEKTQVIPDWWRGYPRNEFEKTNPTHWSPLPAGPEVTP